MHGKLSLWFGNKTRWCAHVSGGRSLDIIAAQPKLSFARSLEGGDHLGRASERAREKQRRAAESKEPFVALKRSV